MCSKRKHKYLNIQYKLWAKNSILFEKGYVLMRNGKDERSATHDVLPRLHPKMTLIYIRKASALTLNLIVLSREVPNGALFTSHPVYN